MRETIGEHNIHQYLTAFADGELSDEMRAQVLKYLETAPSAIRTVQVEMRLRAAAKRVMGHGEAPQSIKDRVAAIEPPAELVGRDTPSRWRALAAAIVLFVAGGLVGHFALSRNQSAADPIVAASLVADVTRVHVDCSRFAAALHAGAFPAALGELADNIKKDLSRDVPYPDLTSAGYQFIGAGPCRKPLDNTVHLLYGSTAPNVHDTISLFTQPFVGQVQIDPGKAYLVAGADDVHPMIVWRSDHVVYFLVGDNAEEVERVKQQVPYIRS